MSAMADQRPRITEFNVGNFEGSLYEGGWHKEPRFKPCYSSEALTRHVNPQNDGLGSAGYLNLAEKAERSGSSLKRGACIVGVMKYAVSPANSIPKAFSERVQRRLSKGEREDEQALKTERAAKRVRKTPAAAAAAAAAAGSTTTAERDARAMPPPQAIPDKRRALLTIKLNEFVPAAHSTTEARLVPVPADEVIVMAESQTPSQRVESIYGGGDGGGGANSQLQDLPPPLLDAPSPAARPFSLESPAPLAGLLGGLPTPLREDQLISSMAASGSGAAVPTFMLPSPAPSVSWSRQATPANSVYTPASQSDLALLLSPMALLAQLPSPSPALARTSQRVESAWARPDTADVNNVYAVLDSIEASTRQTAAASASARLPSINDLEL